MSLFKKKHNQTSQDNYLGFNSIGNDYDNFSATGGFESSNPDFSDANNKWNNFDSANFESSIPTHFMDVESQKRSLDNDWQYHPTKKRPLWPKLLLPLLLLLAALYFLLPKILIPHSYKSGDYIISPKNKCTIPFSVTNDTNHNAYIYLDSSDDNDDTAFWVDVDDTVTVAVPEGVFDFYYATGNEWISIEDKFGPNTEYHKSMDVFPCDNDHAWTVTIFLTVQNDSNVQSIPASQFPI